jgi:hypothetical protein
VMGTAPGRHDLWRGYTRSRLTGPVPFGLMAVSACAAGEAGSSELASATRLGVIRTHEA